MNITLTPTVHGRMFVLPNDQYVGQSIIAHGEFSPLEADFITQLIQPGWTVLECGANLGGLTLPIASRVGPTGKVLGFEPQRLIAALANASLFLNRYDWATILPWAVGEEESTVSLAQFAYAEEKGNYGGITINQMKEDRLPPSHPGHTSAIPTPIRTIDNICEEWKLSPHFIKLDIEGMELAALKGASATIDRCLPWMWVECDRFNKNKELLEFLEGKGYRSWWTVLSHYRHTEGPHTFNFLCCPPNSRVEGLGAPEAFSYDPKPPVEIVYDTGKAPLE